MIICCECRKPDDNMMLLLPRPGFVDIRRPCCSNCYLNGGNPANPKLAVYLQQRFEQVEMPDPIPAAIAHVWTADNYNHHAQGVVRYLHGLAKEVDAPEKALHVVLDVEPKADDPDWRARHAATCDARVKHPTATCTCGYVESKADEERDNLAAKSGAVEGGDLGWG